MSVFIHTLIYNIIGVVWITFKEKTGNSIRNYAGTGLFGSFKENNCFGNEIFILVFTQESAD